MSDQVAVHRVDLEWRAELDGKPLPVSGFDITYALDSISECRLRLPVGVNVNDMDVSRVPEFLDAVGPLVPVTVYVTATAVGPDGAAPADRDPGFPSGTEFVGFRGYAVSRMWRRDNEGGVFYELVCLGQTIGLAGATQFATGITLPDDGNGGSRINMAFGNDSSGEGGAAMTITALITPQGELAGKLVHEDLWGRGLRPFFDRVITLSSAWTGLNAGRNPAGIALGRINGGAGKGGGRLKAPVLAVAVKPDTGFAGKFDAQLVRTIASALYDIWGPGNTTGDLWDVLTLFRQEFLLSFVPTVDQDGLIPLIPDLGPGKAGAPINPWRVIAADEYWSATTVREFDPKFYAEITQVGIYDRNFSATASEPWNPASASARRIGYDRADLPGRADKGLQGRFLLLPAQQWMVIPSPPGRDSTGAGGSVPDATDPSAAAQGDPAKDEFDTDLGDRYARAVLYTRLYSERAMTLEGRFRWDIAPGSLVKVYTAAERFDRRFEVLWGQVAAVRIEAVKTGEAVSARTSLHIRNLRTQTEHENLICTNHPLYTPVALWTGARLLDYALPGDEES